MTKKSIALLILGAIFIGLFAMRPSFSKNAKDFSVVKISSNLPFNPEYAVPALPDEEKTSLLSALSQRYDYLGGGAESFCFLSADKRYVLKFFKMEYFLPKPWIERFPFFLMKNNLLKHYWERRAARLPRTFKAHKLAHEKLQGQTAVIYAHLNKSNDLNHTVVVRDKKGVEHMIDLDSREFILQRKATPAFKYVHERAQSGDMEGAKRALTALMEMIVYRMREGYIDLDKGIGSNYGFVDGQPMQIDLGHLVCNPLLCTDEKKLSEIFRVKKRLLRWARRYDAALCVHIENEAERLIYE